jgi:hypothetical protein
MAPSKHGRSSKRRATAAAARPQATRKIQKEISKCTNDQQHERAVLKPRASARVAQHGHPDYRQLAKGGPSNTEASWQERRKSSARSVRIELDSLRLTRIWNFIHSSRAFEPLFSLPRLQISHKTLCYILQGVPVSKSAGVSKVPAKARRRCTLSSLYHSITTPHTKPPVVAMPRMLPAWQGAVPVIGSMLYAWDAFSRAMVTFLALRRGGSRPSPIVRQPGEEDASQGRQERSPDRELE